MELIYPIQLKGTKRVKAEGLMAVLLSEFRLIDPTVTVEEIVVEESRREITARIVRDVKSESQESQVSQDSQSSTQSQPSKKSK